ncbi:uncharacterized protein LOC142075020 [Calonectris borealis]|uniref:uncharacterized protein LOC142075020 n=1 Tax=Calonectris borealis TaxID=1323832 RepID=UPI003F4B8B14
MGSVPPPCTVPKKQELTMLQQPRRVPNLSTDEFGVQPHWASFLPSHMGDDKEMADGLLFAQISELFHNRPLLKSPGEAAERRTGSTSGRVQGSCAELTSPARSTIASSPSSARLSSKMQWLHLLCLSLLVLGHILDVHSGNSIPDCCLWMSERPIPRRIVQDYQLQLMQDGCDIPAAVLITTKGKCLCAPLQAPSAVRLQKNLDANSARRAKPQGE